MKIKQEQGVILVEAVLGIAIFAIFVLGLTGTLVYGAGSTTYSGERQRAAKLAEEALEAVRAIHDDAWNEFTFNQSGVQIASAQWEFLGEATTETIGNYTRTITYSAVCRNSSDEIADCPADYTDLHIQKVTALIEWPAYQGFTRSLTQETYLTNWESTNWIQTDWVGGAGQAIWDDETMYDSDDSKFDITTSGQVSLASRGEKCGTKDWPFTTAGNYIYDSDDIEVTGGFAQLVDAGGGIDNIVDTITDSFEYDLLSGENPDIINISGTVYAMVYTGDGRDGYVATVDIDSTGNITEPLIDSLEFDVVLAEDPIIIPVSGDIYAIVYTGNGNDGYVATVEIDSAGNITNSVIDSFEFDPVQGLTPAIIPISGDIYAIVYAGSLDDGYLITVEIDSSGNITEPVVDSYEFDATQGRTPEIIHVSGNIYAISYSGPEDDGWLITVNIDNAGDITNSIIDSFEYDPALGRMSDLIHISGDIYAIAYTASGDDGWLITVDIDNAGNITEPVIDSLKFDALVGKNPIIVPVAGTVYAIAYDGDSEDGFIKIVDIQTNGTIGNSVIDSLEFETTMGKDPTIINVGANDLAIVYSDIDADGQLITVRVTAAASYPVNNPEICPTVGYATSDVTAWTLFEETATKNGGEIYYQLSDDDGATWQYWDGAAWSVAGATDYNTAAVINTNINSFSVTNQKIMFKAFLESDGSQLVQLDEVNIGWGEATGTTYYESFGYLISSALDMKVASSVQIVEWDQTIPSCTPTCEIKFQIRAAPDSGGSPGSWTDWYGLAGSGTYFTNNEGDLISTDLNGNQWAQYRLELIGDSLDSPVLEEVRINHK